MIIRFLLWLARHTPPHVITTRDVGEPYLTRYFLTRQSYKTEGMGQSENAPRFGLYLHHFHRGDDGAELHNHPWRWAVSLVLRGGYSEERRAFKAMPVPGGSVWRAVVVRRTVRPGAINFLTARDFHRVDLLDAEGAWTLFLVGPISQSWGFWDRVSGVFTPWKRFLGIEP